MAKQRVTVEELLLRHRAIDEDHLRQAKDHQKKVGGDLGRVLVELGFVSEEVVLRAQSHQLGIPLVNLEQSPPPKELAQALTEPLCKRFGVIPVSGNLETRLMRVATSQPAGAGRLAQLAEASGFRIEAAAATSEQIEKAIRNAFASSGGFDDFGREPEKPPPEIHPEPDDLGELRERIAKLEKIIANPQFAALLARVERLEQIAEKDHHALNVLGQVLLDLGMISREDLKKRLGRT